MHEGCMRKQEKFIIVLASVEDPHMLLAVTTALAFHPAPTSSRFAIQSPRSSVQAKITGAALAAAFASKDEAADAVEETLEEKEERVIEAIRDGLDAGIGKPRRAFTALGDFGKRSGSLAQTWLTPEQLENCAYFWAGGSTVLARDVSKWRLTARDVKASPWFILLALNTFPWTPLLAPLVARAVNGTGTGAFLPSAFSARRLAALKRLRGDAGLNPESVDPESPDRTPANIDEGVRFFRDGSKIALRDLLRGQLTTRADDKLAAYGWFGFLAVSTFPLTPLLLPVIDKRREGSQSDYVPSAFRARRLAAFHRLNSARETDREADRETEKLLVSKKKLLDAKKKLTDGALDRK